MRWMTFKGIVVGYFDTLIIWGDRFMHVVCVWEWKRLLLQCRIVVLNYLSVIEVAPRDDNVTNACRTWMTWPWTPRVKVKQHKSQMKRYEARHIMVQIQRDTIIILELQPSRIRAALFLSLNINLLRRSKKACIRFMWSPPVFSRAGRSCVFLSKEVPKKHRKARHSGLPAWRQNLKNPRRRSRR